MIKENLLKYYKPLLNQIETFLVESQCKKINKSNYAEITGQYFYIPEKDIIYDISDNEVQVKINNMLINFMMTTDQLETVSKKNKISIKELTVLIEKDLTDLIDDNLKMKHQQKLDAMRNTVDNVVTTLGLHMVAKIINECFSVLSFSAIIENKGKNVRFGLLARNISEGFLMRYVTFKHDFFNGIVAVNNDGTTVKIIIDKLLQDSLSIIENSVQLLLQHKLLNPSDFMLKNWVENTLKYIKDDLWVAENGDEIFNYYFLLGILDTVTSELIKTRKEASETSEDYVKAFNLIKNKLLILLKFEIEQLHTVIGGVFLSHLLEKNNIFITDQEIVKNRKKAYKSWVTIKLKEDLNFTSDLFLNARLHRNPIISTKVIAQGEFKSQNITFKNTLNYDNVRSGHEYITELTPLAVELIVSQQYCIDINFFEGFIEAFENSIKKKDIKLQYLLINIIYNFDLEKIKLHLQNNNVDSEIINLIDDIKNYSLDLNTLWEDDKDIKTLKYKINNSKLTTNQKTMLMYYYNSITGQKYYFYYLLREVLLYSRFNYFYIPRFVSYTGRLFETCLLLGLQGNKIAQGFIIVKNFKQQVNQFDKVLFTKMKDIIISSIQDNNEKENIRNLSYETYKSELEISYKKFFNEPIAKEEILTTSSTVENLILKYASKIKKSKDVLYVLNYIYNLSSNHKYNALITREDATQSFDQNMKTIYRLKTGADLVNLTGNTPNDLYKHFCQDFENYLNSLKNMQEKFTNWSNEMLKDSNASSLLKVLNEGLNQIIENPIIKKHIEYLDPFKIRIKDFQQAWKVYKDTPLENIVNRNDYDYYYTNLPVKELISIQFFGLITKALNNFESNIIVNLKTFKTLNTLFKKDNHFWSTPSMEILINSLKVFETNFIPEILNDTKKLSDYKKIFNQDVNNLELQKNLKKHIAIISRFLRIFLGMLNYEIWLKALDNKAYLKPLILSRDLAKKLIMPFGYGAGDLLLKKNLIEYLKEKLYLNGDSNFNISKTTIIAHLVVDYFRFWRKKNLIASLRTKKLGRIITKAVLNTNKPLTFETPYVRWTFAPYVTEKVLIGINRRQGKRFCQTTLHKMTNILDKSTLSKSSAVVFIHGCDAFVAYESLKRFNNINKALKLSKYEYICHYYLNMDCFGITRAFGPFLPYIVRDSYKSLYNFNPIRILSAILDKSILNLQEKKGSVSYLQLKHIQNRHIIK